MTLNAHERVHVNMCFSVGMYVCALGCSHSYVFVCACMCECVHVHNCLHELMCLHVGSCVCVLLCIHASVGGKTVSHPV